MFELQDIIVNWMDNNNYPPTYSCLPSELYLPGLFCDHVKLWLRKSIVEQREFGTVIYLLRNPVAKLMLGEPIKGLKNHINLELLFKQKCSLPGSYLVGAFHTHHCREHNDFSAPSLNDFTQAYTRAEKYKSMCTLVISPPLENPWCYLIIVSKDTSLYNMDKTIFKACSRAIRRLQINTVTDSIKKEMSHYTNDPSVDQRFCEEIAHDSTLSHICTLYKVGFYSGQNGFLILRKTYPDMLIHFTQRELTEAIKKFLS